MRSLALVLCAVLGCAAEPDDDPTGPREIEFLVRGTLDPLPADSPVDVYLRTQGAFGCEIDIRVYGVPLDEAAAFAIGFVSPEAHPLAEQRFLPTSTAMELEDGSFTIADLPVVFFDDVAQAEVEGAPAILRATMMTSPPTAGELDVTLAYRP